MQVMHRDQPGSDSSSAFVGKSAVSELRHGVLDLAHFFFKPCAVSMRAPPAVNTSDGHLRSFVQFTKSLNSRILRNLIFFLRKVYCYVITNVK